MELHEVLGKDELGVDTVLDLRFAEALDKIDVMSYEMVGSDPSTPKNGTHSAKELRTYLQQYHDFLSLLVNDRSPELTAALNRKFDSEIVVMRAEPSRTGRRTTSMKSPSLRE